jgi:hypothetical protein
VGIVQSVGKTIGSNSCVRGVLRARDPLLCSQGALGRWVVARFTVDKQPVPDMCSQEWVAAPIWPSDRGGALTYNGHAARVIQLLKAAGVSKDKVTHAPRVFAARLADEAGLDDQVRGGTGQSCAQCPPALNLSCA